MSSAEASLVDITDAESIRLLVTKFYSRAFRDELLGSVFVDVAPMDLDAHLPVMVEFWSTVLLGARSYRGGAFARTRACTQRCRSRAGTSTDGSQSGAPPATTCSAGLSPRTRSSVPPPLPTRSAVGSRSLREGRSAPTATPGLRCKSDRLTVPRSTSREGCGCCPLELRISRMQSGSTYVDT